MSRSPELAEVIEAGVAAALEDVHSAMPGRVVSYDAAKQLASVQPLIKRRRLDEDGVEVIESLPVVVNCPVQFPGAGGFVMTFPVKAGDIGLLIFAEGSLDKWTASKGGETDPDDDRRFHLSDGIFIPGIRPGGAARPTPGNEIRIGKEDGSFEPAVLGDKLITWLKAHTHTIPAVGTTGGPLNVALIDAGVTDIRSKDVKIS